MATNDAALPLPNASDASRVSEVIWSGIVPEIRLGMIIIQNSASELIWSGIVPLIGMPSSQRPLSPVSEEMAGIVPDRALEFNCRYRILFSADRRWPIVPDMPLKAPQQVVS